MDEKKLDYEDEEVATTPKEFGVRAEKELLTNDSTDVSDMSKQTQTEASDIYIATDWATSVENAEATKNASNQNAAVQQGEQ